MTPFTRAAQWHLTHCPEHPLAPILEAHLQKGYVFNTPELFIMARRVLLAWDEDRLLDPWDHAPHGNSWHIWLYAGDIKAIAKLIPYPLPYITFHRAGKLKTYPMKKLMPRLRQHRPLPSSAID